MIEYKNMKRYISILSVLACVCGMDYARASECVDESDCDIETIESEYTVDVLEPNNPDEDLWFSDDAVTDAFCEVIDDEEIIDYNCPFDTDDECEIWARKPMYTTTALPRNPHLSYVKTDGILATLTFNGEISANDEMARPLLNRYLALMRASRACCNAGIVYKMRMAGTKEENVYNFLIDDANQYDIGGRCMVMDDGEIQNNYSNGVNGAMVMDVRNTCLCKNRQWVDSLLEPFYDLYQLAPDFETMPFEYTYLDGLQREVTVSVNADVQTVMEMLQSCPD